MRSRLATFVLLLIAGFTTSLAAQGRDGVELGIDLELTYSTDDPNVTVVTLPSGNFRVAFPVNPNISLEPRISFQYASANGSSVTLIDVQFGVLWHVSTDPTKSTLYLRPFFGHTHAGGSFGSGDASSIGGGVGFKIPQGERLAIRIEGGYQHSLEDGVSGQIFAMLGLSFFTR